MIAFEEEERYADGVLGGVKAGRQHNDIPSEIYQNGNKDIFAAARVGDSDRVQYLLNSDSVDVLGFSDDEENTPIHLAAACGHVDVVALLTEFSACVNAKNRQGRSPLYCAVLNGHTAVVQQLISAAADVNAADVEGNTPLLHAICEERVDVVRLLLSNDAASDQRNLNGISPMKIAIHKGNPAIVKLLKTHADYIVHQRETSEAADLFTTTCLPSTDCAKAFAQSVARGTTVTQLNLTGSILGVSGARALGLALASNETITKLRLAGTLRVPEEAEVLFGSLVMNTTVQELDVSSCDGLGGATTPHILHPGPSSSSSGSQNAGAIDAGLPARHSGSGSAGHGSGGGGMVHLSRYLAAARCLRLVDVSYVVQSTADCETLASGVRANTGLITLRLIGSSFAGSRRHKGVGAAVKALAEAVRCHKSLEDLSLAGAIWLGDDGVALAPLLASSCALQRLDIHGADLTPSAVKVIVNVVKQRTKELSLVMDAQDMKLLANAQQLHAAVVKLQRGGSNLMDLNLKDCISDESEAVKLFEALRSNSTVASLTLQGNSLGVQALRVLSECLMQPKIGLSSLNLSSCIQSTEELFAFVSGLKRNTSVKYLNINNCPLSHQTAIDMLCDCLTANNTLLRIKGIPTEVAAVLAPYLEINQTIAGEPCPAPDMLFRCIRVGKHGAIPLLLSRYPKLSVQDPNGTLLHALLLQQEQPQLSGLLAVFRAHWLFDNNVSEILEANQSKFDVFRQVVLKLTDEDWIEKESDRTILHVILTECRSRFLNPTQTMLLIREITAKKPTLNAARDRSGLTPAEIAAFCIQAPEIQSLFLMGIISALQRRGWELEASQQEAKALRTEAASREIALQNRIRQLEAHVTLLESDRTKYHEGMDEQAHRIRTLQTRLQNGLKLAEATPEGDTDDSRSSEDLEEIDIVCQEFNYNDVTYLIDTSTNKVYSTESGNPFVGKFMSGLIDFSAVDSDDESEGEDGYNDTARVLNGLEYDIDHEPATVQL
eukprot:m.1011495 g.1011495  ORF g.1011495 m.1011495 type:complete len:1003 (+) comp24062_c0_seq17:385-3393(+)